MDEERDQLSWYVQSCRRQRDRRTRDLDRASVGDGRIRVEKLQSMRGWYEIGFEDSCYCSQRGLGT
jgi:hypothetical protein